jgi:molybdopterin synthase catalytic subunit
VRYFAAARELASCDSELVTLPAVEVSSADLLELLALLHPRLAPYLSRLRLAINDELRYDAPFVKSGDVVDVMPPVAGGAPEAGPAWIELEAGRGRVGLLSAPLSVDEAMRAVSHPSSGGIALFVGVVRDHAEGRAVDRLDYEAHEKLALRELANVANEVLAEQAEVRAFAVHRVGKLAIGDLAVVVAASAPHRAEAFTACRALIEKIKERVPIWKKEWAADGSANWVNLSG